MSVHGWTASSTTYTYFLRGGKAQIYLIKPKDSYGEEITEKKKKRHPVYLSRVMTALLLPSRDP